MWMDHYLRAESEEAFLAASPDAWKDENGMIVGQNNAVVDVVGAVGAWYLVNLRLAGALPEGMAGMAIPTPEHRRRVFA